MLEAIGEQELRLALQRLWTPIVSEIDPDKGNIFTALEGCFLSFCDDSALVILVLRLFLPTSILIFVLVIIIIFPDTFCHDSRYHAVGIHFLPVDKHVYLRIQSFINLIENTFDCIVYSSFLYKNFLVWSGLEQDDMLKIYKFLVCPVIVY
jgi:hypothetical protein